jgi:hypothetical protein
MNTILLSRIENYIAFSQLEAEAQMNALKQAHGANIQKNSITKKTKKETEYFIVSVTLVFEKIADVL